MLDVRGPNDNGALTVTLNNPARRNALGPAMVNELLYALEDSLLDDGVRSVVLTGAGSAFCAGGDFAALSHDDADALPPKGDYALLLRAMLSAHKPIIARVNGHAMGGGLGLVAAAHFAIAASSAKLGTPEIDVGLFPMMIMAVLRRHVPSRRLTELMLLGQKLEAAEAMALGIVGRVVPLEELDAAVAELTTAIAKKSPITVKLGLEAMSASEDLGLDEALPMLRDRLAGCLATEDAHEGLTAFLEKRAPVWRGK
ncbi:MAG: enoyl-CoA hydratase [Myxococcales bacterium]|nr:enoyl-CoA hydratase [Myxococcales bacterium]